MPDETRIETSQPSERLFRMLFESSPDAIFIEDLDGRVLDCNPAAAQLHGTVSENIIGKHVSQLVPADRREGLVGGVSIETPVEFEGYSLRADGLAVPVSIRTSLIEYLGKPALLLHVRDITDRKRQEVELRRLNDALESRVRQSAAELARVNEALREQTAQRQRLEQDRGQYEGRIESMRSVAYDLNNLLTNIMASCDFLVGRLSSENPMHSDLVLIQEAARKASAAASRLLSFSQKQST